MPPLAADQNSHGTTAGLHRYPELLQQAAPRAALGGSSASFWQHPAGHAVALAPHQS